jgi:predicted ATPase
MFLRQLTLENVRSIRHLEMSFTTPADAVRKWTFVLGENGAGKSTILRAIGVLLAGSEALPELLSEPDAWITLGETECSLRGELVTADGDLRHVAFKIHRGDNIRETFRRNQVQLDELDNAVSFSARNYFTVGYGVSRRSSESDASINSRPSMRNQRAQNVATLFANDAYLNPLESWAMDLDYRRGDAALEVIRNALNGLLPGVTFKGIDKEGRRLLFETADGDLPLQQLSDGYKNVAAWCGDLLYRITETFADYKDPLTTRGLLLVDEIDLHLHPVWQRELVAFLTATFPNMQVIATTHSPLTAHQAGSGELFTLRRETATSPPVLYHYPGEPRNLMLHQLLVSPVFGLSTLDSRQVELLKDEYRDLDAKSSKQLKPVERRRLSQLRQELQDLPDWGIDPSESPGDHELLAKAQQVIGGAISS